MPAARNILGFKSRTSHICDYDSGTLVTLACHMSGSTGVSTRTGWPGVGML